MLCCLLSLGPTIAALGERFGYALWPRLLEAGAAEPRTPCSDSSLRAAPSTCQAHGWLRAEKRSPWHFAHGSQRPWVWHGVRGGVPAWRVQRPHMTHSVFIARVDIQLVRRCVAARVVADMSCV